MRPVAFKRLGEGFFPRLQPEQPAQPIGDRVIGNAGSAGRAAEIGALTARLGPSQLAERVQHLGCDGDLYRRRPRGRWQWVLIRRGSLARTHDHPRGGCRRCGLLRIVAIGAVALQIVKTRAVANLEIRTWSLVASR